MSGRIRTVLLLSLITAVSLFLRAYRLDVNPPGLFKDEVAIADLSYKLLATGRDFRGNYLPLSPRGYSTYPPLNIYPLVLFIRILGLNGFGVRILSAILGTLMVPLAYLLARRLFDEKTAFIASVLTAFSPWGVTYSRMYLGILQQSFFFTLGLYFLVKGMDGDRRLVLLGGLSIGMTLFSYYLSHLFLLIFLPPFHFLFIDEIRKAGKTREYYIALSIVFLSMVVSTVNSRLDVFAPVPPSTAAGIITSFTHNLLEEVDAMLLSKGGWDWPYYTTLSGVFYPVLVPFLIAGVLMLIGDKRRFSLLPVYWLAVSLITGALTSSLFVGSLRRALTCAGPAAEIIIAYGIVRVLGFYGKDLRMAGLLALLTAVGLVLGVYQFFDYYFVRQPGLTQMEMVSMTPVKEVFNYTESVRDSYRVIYFTSGFDTTFWDNSNMTFDDYRLFYTRRLGPDSKYVFGGMSSYSPGNGNLYITRDFELVNATPIRVFRCSNGVVAYKAVA